jgi:hypothetical protein
VTTVHLLRIPKTGGTALATALSAAAAPIVFHDHFTRLADVPRGERVVFGVRDPVARFVSGFNSRLRKGQPRNYNEWSSEEAECFALLSTPNALAEALSSEDLRERRTALVLIRAIFHTGVPLAYWLGSADDLASRAGDVLCVLAQERLAEDFEVLKELLGIRDAALPEDDFGAHRTPPGFETRLSERAVRNLRAWYSGDEALVACSLALRERILAARVPAAPR